jgi:hypothetical protein
MPAIGITGHRNLPAALAEQISALLHTELDAIAPATDLGPGPGPLTGVTCLADGADTLFAEAVLARGGTLEAIIPAADYRDSLPAEHHPAYDRLLAAATTVHRLGHAHSAPDAHMAASLLMLTRITTLLAVWDGLPARGPAGTADVVTAARTRHLPTHIVWPHGAVRL